MYLRFDDTLSISCLNNLCIVCDLPYNRKGKSGMKWLFISVYVNVSLKFKIFR